MTRRAYIPKAVKEWIWTRDQAKCQLCGEPGKHIDHVLPLERGGTNDPGNLRLLCAHCNTSRPRIGGPHRTLPPEELIRLQRVKARIDKARADYTATVREVADNYGGAAVARALGVSRQAVHSMTRDQAKPEIFSTPPEQAEGH